MVLRDNVSVREAAKRLRISRNTAKRWLTEPEMVEPHYPKRVAAERLIDAYTEHLRKSPTNTVLDSCGCQMSTR
jgi:transposase